MSESNVPAPYEEYKIMSGEGEGQIGQLCGFNESGFGHRWYTLLLEDGSKITVREERVEKVEPH